MNFMQSLSCRICYCGLFTKRISTKVSAVCGVTSCFASTMNNCIPDPTNFRPKKALILTKLSRYEFEKMRFADLSDEELEAKLKNRGSDYNTLLYHHYHHKSCENTVLRTLEEQGIETKVVNRFDYTEGNIQWADVVFTTGGDGTFLLASSKIQDSGKPVIGFNSDPTRSVGHLCLPKKYSVNVKEAVDKLLQGKFRWTFRKRIRITLIGDKDKIYDPPIELHDQQLNHPEYRFMEDLQEQHKSVFSSSVYEPEEHQNKRVLPVLALNEVYIGEVLSARVSYYEMSINAGHSLKTKSSGLCVSTGTGSTSWTYNISKLTNQAVEEIVGIIKNYTDSSMENIDHQLIDEITATYNNKLIFDPEKALMIYNIRDPVPVGSQSSVLDYRKPRGLAKRIRIKSRCFDACLVIDGGLSFSFNDGTAAELEIHDSDSLKTVTLIEK